MILRKIYLMTLPALPENATIIFVINYVLKIICESTMILGYAYAHVFQLWNSKKKLKC